MVAWSTIGRRRLYWVLVTLVLVMDAVVLGVGLPAQPVMAYVAVLAMFAVEACVFLYYVKHFRKEKLRYPLVPPEGKGDVYLPKTDIPETYS